MIRKIILVVLLGALAVVICSTDTVSGALEILTSEIFNKETVYYEVHAGSFIFYHCIPVKDHLSGVCDFQYNGKILSICGDFWAIEETAQ